MVRSTVRGGGQPVSTRGQGGEGGQCWGRTSSRQGQWSRYLAVTSGTSWAPVGDREQQQPISSSVLTLAPYKTQLSSVHLLQLSVGGSEGNNSESGPRTFANYFKYFSTFLTYFWCLNLACYESYAAPSYSYSWQCDIESNCVIAF